MHQSVTYEQPLADRAKFAVGEHVFFVRQWADGTVSVDGPLTVASIEEAPKAGVLRGTLRPGELAYRLQGPGGEPYGRIPALPNYELITEADLRREPVECMDALAFALGVRLGQDAKDREGAHAGRATADSDG